MSRRHLSGASQGSGRPAASCDTVAVWVFQKVSSMVQSVKTEASHAWCLFRSQTSALAVPLERVSEIVAVDRLVQLPFSPPSLLGLCTIRREVIPVICLQSESSEECAKPYRPTGVLILRTDQGSWGIGINREGIAVLDESIPEEGTTGTEPQPQEFPGVIMRGEDAYTIIHPEEAWVTVRAALDRWYRTACPEDSTTLSEIAP
jgi:hypothetical protein